MLNTWSLSGREMGRHSLWRLVLAMVSPPSQHRMPDSSDPWTNQR